MQSLHSDNPGPFLVSIFFPLVQITGLGVVSAAGAGRSACNKKEIKIINVITS